MRILLLPAFLFFSLSLVAQRAEWACKMKIQDEAIRFTLSRSETGDYFILNGTEKVETERKAIREDSVELALSIFDARLVFPKNPGKQFAGWYRKGDAKVPSSGLRFEAEELSAPPAFNAPEYRLFKSRWPLEFLEGEKVQDKGILLLNQQGERLEGSILTETGDYRFLNGKLSGRKAFLQTFDGGHAWFFRMEFSEDGKSLKGEFLYSQNGKQAFRGMRNDAAELAGGFSKPELKEKLHFTGSGSDGKNVSEKDFEGKAMVIQVMGSWCPNCLDETRFLVEEFAARPKGIEFVALAFERKNDAAYAAERIATVKRKLSVPYPILWGGNANKDSASKALPAAGGIKAFPTTLFVKKNGEVLKVHSGFSGPATGEAYDAWRKEFRLLLKELEID